MDVVAMTADILAERRFTSAGRLALGLTVMQIGLDLLGDPRLQDGAGSDRGTIVRALVVANGQIQAAAAVLCPAQRHPPAPRT
jgi:hypothetical protein